MACWPEPHWRSTVVPGNCVREAGREYHVAADVHGLLADLGHVAEDDVLDNVRRDAGPLDDLVENARPEVHRVRPGKDAVAAAHGRADGGDDDYITVI